MRKAAKTAMFTSQVNIAAHIPASSPSALRVLCVLCGSISPPCPLWSFSFSEGRGLGSQPTSRSHRKYLAKRA